MNKILDEVLENVDKTFEYKMGFQNGKAEGYLKGYADGSLAVTEEIKDHWYKKGRADAFQQMIEQMKAYRDAHYYSFANYDVQKYADGFKSATDTLISMVEQIKEQENGKRI